MMRLVLYILLLGMYCQCYGQTSISNAPRVTARLIMDNAFHPSDDSLTFMVMDSIMADKESIRDYYFPAFQKIVEKADGALAEVIGSYVLLYVKKYPKEFSNRYTCCLKQNSCCDNLIHLATHAGQETMLRVHTQEEYSDLLNQMTLNYQNWRSDKLLALFIKEVDSVRREWRD